jgi:asparagine synthase (glutamine-hydrolysing)
MCGIVGVVTPQGCDENIVNRLRDELTHRGPDDAGLWVSDDKQIALASRRLSIHDLSPSGHMPMSDVSGRVWITYNGEVYNFQILRAQLKRLGHTFHSHSDTEVVLAAYLEWGTKCLSRLNGMFAFAIYDGRSIDAGGRRLFLARDRAGEKPLYYIQWAGEFVFASELKALMSHPSLPRRLSYEALNYFLALGYVPGDKCILEGVRKLPPAHALVYELDNSSLQVWRYWSVPVFSGSSNIETLSTELEDLLLESVRLRMMADVPVGILLSGGVDSSLVTAMAARASPTKVKTFTIGLPGFAHYDERAYARCVAEYFGTDHYELLIDESAFELLPQLAAQYDEPLGDSSLVPTYLVSRLTKQHVTVALGGDGGDELFGGYLHYGTGLRRKKLRKWIPNVARLAGAGIASKLPTGIKGRNFLLTLKGEPENAFVIGNVFDLEARRRLVAAEMQGELAGRFHDPELYKLGLGTNEGDLVQWMTRLDFETYLPEDILTKIDRASMAVSLELRAPWLDQHIIEFAFSKVPSELKSNGNRHKILTRHLARRILPNNLDIDRKQGFSLPLSSWFKGAWEHFCVSVLSDADRRLFNRQELEKLLKGQQRGYSNTTRLFALTMFELWRRHYKIEL